MDKINAAANKELKTPRVIAKLREHGVVSRALVTDKQKDELVSTHSSGRRGNSSYTTTNNLCHICTFVQC